MPVDDPRINQGIKALARIIADAYCDDSENLAPEKDDGDEAWSSESRSVGRSTVRPISGQRTVQLDGFARNSNSELRDDDG